MPELLPLPERITADEGTFVFDASTRIAADEALLPAALRLQRALQPSTGLPLALAGPGEASVRFIVDEQRAAEHYQLDVSSARIEIRAADPAGAGCAVETLRQLLPAAVYRRAAVAETAWCVPAVRIQDGPAFGWRGLMLDVSRHFFPPHEVMRVIDQLAAHKLNVLHLHLSDDQGWRLQIRRHPRLTEVGSWRRSSQIGGLDVGRQDGRPHGGFYTQDDAREIVAYAAWRGVTVVPEIEMPGHVQAALAAYPHLGVADGIDAPWTGWGINENVLNVEESTVDFFCEVLDEVCDIFPSTYIGIGGDECPKTQWESSPRVAERMRELGIEDARGLQSWFISRIDAHLSARGRRAFGWDEILEGGLAPGATVASWRGTTGLVAAARSGHDGVACPEDRVYFDYRQSDRVDEPVPVQVVTTVADVYGFDPVPAELEPTLHGHILGGQANLWTEQIDDARRADYMLFPRLCALAEALWSAPDDRDVVAFEKRLDAHRRRLDAAGIEYRPTDGPHPWQTRPGVSGKVFTRAERAATVAALTADLV